MDAAGQFLVDLEDFPDLAVLPVGGLRADVFQRQAVLIDALMRRCQRGHELLRADDEDDVGGAPGVRGELAPRPVPVISRIPGTPRRYAERRNPRRWRTRPASSAFARPWPIGAAVFRLRESPGSGEAPSPARRQAW